MPVSATKRDAIIMASRGYQQTIEDMAGERIFELSQQLGLEEDTVRKIWEDSF